MDQKNLSIGTHIVPSPHIPAGHERKVTQRTLNVIHRKVKAQSSITSQEIKQKNLHVLAGVAERTVGLIEEGPGLQEVQTYA